MRNTHNTMEKVMRNKPTMAESHVAKRNSRLVQKYADKLANRPMPKFLPGSIHGGSLSTSIIADQDGTLYRLDPDAGTIRRVRWER